MPDSAGDHAHIRHRETVRALMRDDGVLSGASPHATMNQPGWFTNLEKPTPTRDALHRRLLEDYRAKSPDVPEGREAIVLAGPPGAGKSTVLRQVLGEDAPRWLVIDPDEFKKDLLRQAIADGTYESRIKPAEVKALEAQGEKFAPLELASLVHAESSKLAEIARQKAVARGQNVVIDSSLRWEDHRENLMRELTNAGYTIRVIDVECTYPVSAARIEHRWRQAVENPSTDPTDLGDRWVPSEYVKTMYPHGPEGPTWCEINARTMAQTCPAVTRYEVYRVDHPAASPRLESRQERVRPGAPLVDFPVTPTVPDPAVAAPSPTMRTHLGQRTTPRHVPTSLRRPDPTRGPGR